MTWERKILRKIYGPKYEQGVWKIRSNPELQNACKSPDTVTEIKFRRLECLRYVSTTEEMILNTKPEVKCEVERPKMR
jgi:hypothetical protein